MTRRLSLDERRIVLTLLDHQPNIEQGTCSCGYTCDPGSAWTLATHTAHHLTDPQENQ